MHAEEELADQVVTNAGSGTIVRGEGRGEDERGVDVDRRFGIGCAYPTGEYHRRSR